MSRGDCSDTPKVRQMRAPEKDVQGLRVRIGGWSGPSIEGDLFAYRPPQWTDLSEAMIYGASGVELIRLPPLWMVLRPADGPLLWIRLNHGAETPLGGTLMIEWATEESSKGMICGVLCGETAPWATLGANEALLRLGNSGPQGRAILDTNCGQVLRHWLWHAQQVGVAI